MWLAVVILSLVSAARAADAPNVGAQVERHLDRTVDWYRRVSSMDQAQVRAEELLFRESAARGARRAARLGFDAARAQAEMLSAAATAGSPATRPGQAARGARLSQTAVAAAERVEQLRARLGRMDEELRTASGEPARLLSAQRETAAAELELATARRDVLQQLAGAMGAAATTGAGGLIEKVDAVERSVPEVRTEPGATPTSGDPGGATPATPAGTAPQRPFNAESAGLLQLITEMFALSGRMSELRALANDAEELRESNERLRTPIRNQLIELSRRGEAAPATQTTQPGEADPEKLSARRTEVEGLTVRFRQLAAAGVPLGEQSVVLDAARATLMDWHGALARNYGRALRHLLVRLAVIGVAIAVVVGISMVWRRATFRYVHDARRRRQFMLLRRIVVAVLIVLVMIVGLVTEVGSLATFAGILTAGIAVSLQTLILSGVAYFFFVGRYGVRVGDRVTVGGVTGDVMETGLFRLYLMELGGTQKQRPTGRIVVFSNSVLFQPSGFFKQAPGTEYLWHEISMTLAPDSNYKLAEERLMGAVESVVAGYREQIERQYETVRRNSPVPVEPPKTEGRLRLVDAGLEFIVRYPVELRRAAEIDDLVTRRLLEAIDREPKLRIVPTGTPRIQAAV